jgi:ribosome-binding protein aMBF1 (putative translation factor)
MKKEIDYRSISSLEDLLDAKYGKKGQPDRDVWEREYEAFKLGVIIYELRKQRNLTQQQLAEKCGTTKSYISRIENDASDIRLSTLMRIIQQGLGARLHLLID